MSVAESAEQCRAITANGTRCSHRAQEDGFCHQHDESDPTVDEQSDGDETGGASGDENDTTDKDANADDTDGEASEEPTSGDDSETADGSAADGDVGDGGDGVGDILEVRKTVHAVAERIIGEELDGVIEITRDGDDWIVMVEVVERHAVPNTQDILGKYEVVLNTSGTVTSYRRLDTYRRGDTSRGDITP